MTNELYVTSSPHIHSPKSTRAIMLDVLIALMPAAIASVVLFGARAAVLEVFCVALCVGLEALWCRLRHIPSTAGDLSAAVSGLLLAFNLPAGLPVWQAALGCVVAIIVVKMLFGGIGRNFVNPALAGRVVMAVSFAGAMTEYAYPAAAEGLVASATPLRIIEGGGSVDPLTLFLGVHGGVLGEVSCAALLAGGIYLAVRGVIKPITPLVFILSETLFAALFGCAHPIEAALSGGLFLGAIFMATDYTTTPFTNLGKAVFGLGCGLITALIRTFANSTEGVSYAILLMNLVVPYINDLCRRRPFGKEAGR